MRKLLLYTLSGILLFQCLSLIIKSEPAPVRQGCSTLATCAAAMSAGTWFEFTAAEASLTADMTNPNMNTDGGSYNFGNSNMWDSTRHIGYFWFGTHDLTYTCYHGISDGTSSSSGGFTYSGTASAGTASYAHVPQFSVNSGTGDHATFNISKAGGVYTVTRDPDYGVDPTYNNGGQYNTGNILLIKGTSLGGTSPTNDLSITVTGLSEFNTARSVACANLSQRFVKYSDSDSAFHEVLDAITMNPNSNWVSGDVGGHLNESLVLDTLTGTLYKYFPGHSQQFTQSNLFWQTTNTDLSAYVSTPSNFITQGHEWFPDANGQVYVEGAVNGSGFLMFLPSGSSTWQKVIGQGIGSGTNTFTWGDYVNPIIYNAVTHKLLVGGGGCTSGSPCTDNVAQYARSFNNISYSAGVWTGSPTHTIPFINTCGQFITFGTVAQTSVAVVDPVSGKLLVITTTPSCTPIMYQVTLDDVNPANDTWLALSGNNVPPSNVKWPLGGNGGYVESTAIPEYGVIMFVDMYAGTIGHRVYLYKPGAVSGNAPTTPTGLTSTGTSAISAEFKWTAATGGSGNPLAGYKIYQAIGAGSYLQVGTSTFPIFNATGLSANTAYHFKVSAYGADGTEGSQSSALNVTTDATLYTFAQKCGLSGVLKCEDWDDQANMRYYWATGTIGGTACNTELTGLGYSNYGSAVPNTDVTTATFANAQAVYLGSGVCNYPIVDTVTKHSGTGSLKMPVQNHAAGSLGEYYGWFKRYMDGHFGYVGPTTSSPFSSATHEGNDLYLQWYERVDTRLLNTPYPSFLHGGYYSTASAGSRQIDLFACTPTTSDVVSPIPSTVIGKHIWFYGAGGTNFTEGQFLISGLANATTAGGGGYCSAVLSVTPTPSAAGTFCTGCINEAQNYEQGFIEGTSMGDSSWKTLGLFGNPGSGITTCCTGATQISLNLLQRNIPFSYGYSGGGVALFDPSPGGLLEDRPGCILTGAHPDVTAPFVYPEPPCIRYHANQWQEHTIHLQNVAPTTGAGTCPIDTTQYHGVYQYWIDGQIIHDISNFVLCYGATGFSSNGLGQFNWSPYQTNRDPNTDAGGDTALWADDFIISTSPIPMMSADVPITNLVITTLSVANGQVGSGYSQTLSASNGTAPYTWSVNTGSLPAGLTLHSSTGVIDGIPTTATSYNFTVRVTDNVSATFDRAFSITIVPNNGGNTLTITTGATLPPGTTSLAYSDTLSATGGTAPYTWSAVITSGGAGPHVGLDVAGTNSTQLSDGVMVATGPWTASASGTAVNAWIYCGPGNGDNVTLGVYSDSAGEPATRLFQTAGVSSCVQSGWNGPIPISGSITMGTDYWVAMNSATGLPGMAYTANAGHGRFVAQAYSPGALPSSFPAGAVFGVDASWYIELAGTTTNPLPPGLTLNSNGTITGTPTTAGTTSFDATVTDAAAGSATQTFSLTINNPSTLSISTSSQLSTAIQGLPYTQPLTGVGGTTPYSWTVTTGALPTGLSLDSASGVISGTPSGTTTTFTVTLTDFDVTTTTKQFTLTVGVQGTASGVGRIKKK